MSNASELISDLVKIDTLKTWSVIVTLFGDLDGNHLSGADIRELLEHAGIKPEAIRVALHRLKKDGWITVEKEGREARYLLSKFGHQETAKAAADVYRSSPKYASAPSFVLIPPENRETHFLKVAKDVALIPPNEAVPEKSIALEIQDEKIPLWLEHAVVSPKMLETAKQLTEIVNRTNMGNFQNSGKEQQVLRLLILHYWRRIALRSECWAHMALLQDGTIAQCHRPVVEFLKSSAQIRMEKNEQS